MFKLLFFIFKKLKHDLINFKCVSEQTDDLEFHQELPKLREQWLAKLNAQ
jgi:hypothetical protein